MDGKFFERFEEYAKTYEKPQQPTMNKSYWPGEPVEGDVGIEIEVEASNALPAGRDLVQKPLPCVQWETHMDGSLRRGMEYTTRGAAKISDVPALVANLFDSFRKFGTNLNNSNRCSTHVHVNVSKLKPSELTSIIVLWYTLEDIIIPWCGIERVNNHFCLPNSLCRDAKEHWVDYLKTGVGIARDNLKYSALNLSSLSRFGSLEFRCGPIPDEPERVILWISFLHHFKEYAVNTFPNPVSIGYALSEIGALEIFKEMCSINPEFKEKIYNDIVEKEGDNFNIKCMKSFRDVQDILYEFPWDRWTEEAARPYVPNPFESPKSAKKKYAIENPLRDRALDDNF